MGNLGKFTKVFLLGICLFFHNCFPKLERSIFENLTLVNLYQRITNSYSLSVRVAGLQTNSRIQVEALTSNQLEITSDGTYTFPIRFSFNDSYSVRIVSASQASATISCQLQNGAGRFTRSDISNVTINCSSMLTPSPPASQTPPSGISFPSGQTVFRFAPNAVINPPLTPSVTGTVTSWSLNTALPTGMNFDSLTGVISGTPDVSYQTTAFPLTSFTITATNSGGSTSLVFQLAVPASGENIWTIINGDATGTTLGTNNAMRYDSVSNCIYVLGKTSVNLDGEIIPSTVGSNYSGFISKYSLNGVRIWTRVFGIPGGGASDTTPLGLVFDTSGNIYIAGTASTGTISGLTITATYSGFVAKYDPNGNLVWINSNAPGVRFSGSGITIDASGNVYLATIVNASFMHFTNNSWTDAGLSIVKYDGSTGAYLTSAMFSSNAGSFWGIEAYGIASDSSGNFYVATGTRSSTYCGSGGSTYRPVLIRIDSSLNYQGCTAIVNNGTNSFTFSVTVDNANSSVYISGYTNGTLFDGVTVTGTFDAFLTKINFSGIKVWTRLLSVSGFGTAGTSVAFDSSGFVYMAGVTGGNLGGQTISGTQDSFIAKYNPSGTLIWSKIQQIQNATNGGICDVNAGPAGCQTSITFDNNNTLYSSGSTNGTYGSITNPSAPNYSLFLFKNVK